MNVTVTDPDRRFVIDLSRDDFQVFEDGRPQQVTAFQTSSVPLALALLIDSSASMSQHMGLAQEAAAGFVRALEPSDVASVIDFDSRVQIRQGFTTDREALETAIRRTQADGSTALYNAVYIALKELNKIEVNESATDARRKAIVILSDGEDTSSLIDFGEVMDLATRSNIAIYAIGLREPVPMPSRNRRSQEADFVLNRLAQQTGGRAFFSSDPKQLSGVYKQIRDELASQYFLAYESSNARRDGQFRRIAIRIERRGASARSRAGYFARAR